MCSSLVPYFAHGEQLDVKSTMENGTWTRLQPCRTFCQSVEQRCPYLLPGDRAPAYPTQYAGEPTFLCRGITLFHTNNHFTLFFPIFTKPNSAIGKRVTRSKQRLWTTSFFISLNHSINYQPRILIIFCFSLLEFLRKRKALFRPLEKM